MLLKRENLTTSLTVHKEAVESSHKRGGAGGGGGAAGMLQNLSSSAVRTVSKQPLA